MIAVLCLYLLFAGGTSAQQQRTTEGGDSGTAAFAEFKANGAGTDAFQGTLGFSINKAGIVAGAYRDANYLYHAFVRAANGKITEFEAPDAGNAAGQGTGALNINTAGIVVGVYRDENYAYHGFERAVNGKITEFRAPGAGTSQHQGTVATDALHSQDRGGVLSILFERRQQICSVRGLESNMCGQSATMNREIGWNPSPILFGSRGGFYDSDLYSG